MTGCRRVDVVVLGDGPAGSALALACVRRGIDVLLIGPNQRWSSTYSVWVDDLDGTNPAVEGGTLPADPLIDPLSVAAVVDPTVWVHADRSRELARAYATLDNERFAATLRDGVEHQVGRVDRVTSGARHRVELVEGPTVEARLVIDATGWPSKFATQRDGGREPAWQTAMGVVLREPPDGELGRPTFMDFRAVASSGTAGRRSSVGPSGVATFCYSLPVADGWLVEETVLAARPAVEPIALLPRLAARLGRHPDAVLADAVRTEYVRIPMGVPLPMRDQPVVAFGAGAGYIHPATGFSVASSLRAAPRVAEAIEGALAAVGESAGIAVDPGVVADAVWTVALRRTRIMHDYGLDVLLDLDDDQIRSFFGAFFALSDDQWSSYLRIDSMPGEVAAVMGALFKSSTWNVRRRLMGRNPAALARLLRP